MSAITLQFCKFKSEIGRIIAWGTEGDINHVDCVLPDWHPRGGDLLGAQHESDLGGMPAGYQVRPANYTDGIATNRKRLTMPCSDAIDRAAINWAWGQIGVAYDVRAIEGIFFDQDWSSPSKLICSGAAMGLLTQASPPMIGHPLPKHWRIMTPEEVLLVCATMGDIVQLPD